MKNTSHSDQIAFRQWIGKEVAADKIDPFSDRRSADNLSRQWQSLRQIEDNAAQRWITLASRNREVTRGSAQVNQRAKALQIEGANNLRRTDQAIAVHTHQEFAFGRLVTKKVRKNRPVKSIGLFPAVAALAHRVGQVAP